MKDSLKNLAITEEEDDGLEFADLGNNNDTTDYDLCLVGTFERWLKEEDDSNPATTTMMEPGMGRRRVIKETAIKMGNRQETMDRNHCLILGGNIETRKETPISNLNDIQSFPNMEEIGLEIAEERKRRRGNVLSMGQKITIACTNTKCMDMDTGIEACESSNATEITKAKGVENEVVNDQVIEMLAGPDFRACPSQ
ncbi:hypothetical protein L6452_17817 [Arctium lappa]|uniref:Uncharacterized protein n=1 Tax=Arctium lappa TaxID=4217 RepID=A0ACB9C4A6_ARCLA|nr:hypothetical protein L6452_17817 [Arctium lappa]